jgi:SagB-type dehydrogenase family enzyme
VIVANSNALPEGVYKYTPRGHTLTKVKDGNPKSLLGASIGTQAWVADAPAVFVFAGVYSRIASRYGERLGEPWTYWESGAATQNMSLKAIALGLSSTVVGGAINWSTIQTAIGVPAEEKVHMLLPVGRVGGARQ